MNTDHYLLRIHRLMAPHSNQLMANALLFFLFVMGIAFLTLGTPWHHLSPYFAGFATFELGMWGVWWFFVQMSGGHELRR